jgi:hypothetical protein
MDNAVTPGPDRPAPRTGRPGWTPGAAPVLGRAR